MDEYRINTPDGINDHGVELKQEGPINLIAILIYKNKDTSAVVSNHRQD